LTLLLSYFVDHLFYFHQDSRLHHKLTESELLQNGQTLLTMDTKLGIVMTKYNSLKHDNTHKFIIGKDNMQRGTTASAL